MTTPPRRGPGVSMNAVRDADQWQLGIVRPPRNAPRVEDRAETFPRRRYRERPNARSGALMQRLARAQIDACSTAVRRAHRKSWACAINTMITVSSTRRAISCESHRRNSDRVSPIASTIGSSVSRHSLSRAIKSSIVAGRSDSCWLTNADCRAVALPDKCRTADLARSGVLHR